MTDMGLTVFFKVISIIFKTIQKHHGKHCASEVSQLKEIYYLSASISAKCSYRLDTNSIKNEHKSSDTDIVAYISSLPNQKTVLWIHIEMPGFHP